LELASHLNIKVQAKLKVTGSSNVKVFYISTVERVMIQRGKLFNVNIVKS
jgi:hypothetical protein